LPDIKTPHPSIPEPVTATVRYVAYFDVTLTGAVGNLPQDAAADITAGLQQDPNYAASGPGFAVGDVEVFQLQSAT
jgi:hypothetical protein